MICASARLIAHVGDVVNDFVIHQLRNAFHDLRFVYLIGNFANDNRFATLVQVFNRCLGPHYKLATAMCVGGFNAAASINVSAGGEVRAFYDFQDLFQRRGWSVHQQNRGFHNFREVVWRNVCRHAHGDSVRSIHQQIRYPCRQDRWLNR
jgi:hypothetical protein